MSIILTKTLPGKSQYSHSWMKRLWSRSTRRNSKASPTLVKTWCPEQPLPVKFGDAASRGAGKIPIFPSDGLELLLPGAPVPCPPSIYCIPSPRGQLLPPPTWWPEALLVPVSPVLQNCAGPAVHWTLCWVWSVGKPGFAPRGLLVRKELQVFYCKEKKEEKKQDSGSVFEHRVLTILASPHSSPPPTTCPPLPFCPDEKRRLVLLQPKGQRPQGMPRKERGWKTPWSAPCVGLLWNGSLSFALVLDLRHAKVV